MKTLASASDCAAGVLRSRAPRTAFTNSGLGRRSDGCTAKVANGNLNLAVMNVCLVTVVNVVLDDCSASTLTETHGEEPETAALDQQDELNLKSRSEYTDTTSVEEVCNSFVKSSIVDPSRNETIFLVAACGPSIWAESM